MFAYTVLTAGIFSSQKANEVVNAAIEEVRSTVIPSGSLVAYRGAVDIDGDTATIDTVDSVARIVIPLSVALQGVAIDLTPSYQLNATNKQLERSGETNSLVVTYVDLKQVISDVPWTVSFVGSNDKDFALEATERAMLTLWLVEYDYDSNRGLYYRLGTDDTDPFIDTEVGLLKLRGTFSLEVNPVQGAPLTVDRTIPSGLNAIMNLH